MSLYCISYWKRWIFIAKSVYWRVNLPLIQPLFKSPPRQLFHYPGQKQRRRCEETPGFLFQWPDIQNGRKLEHIRDWSNHKRDRMCFDVFCIHFVDPMGSMPKLLLQGRVFDLIKNLQQGWVSRHCFLPRHPLKSSSLHCFPSPKKTRPPPAPCQDHVQQVLGSSWRLGCSQHHLLIAETSWGLPSKKTAGLPLTTKHRTQQKMELSFRVMFQLDDNENIKLHQAWKENGSLKSKGGSAKELRSKTQLLRILVLRVNLLFFSWLSAMLAVLTPTSTPDKKKKFY